MFTTFAIAPIVEGHGDHLAVPILLRRIFHEMIRDPAIKVLRPIRIPRSKLIKPAELNRAVALANLKLRDVLATRQLVLVIFDADDDPACELAPRLLAEIQRLRPDIDVALVLPVPEYETWFIAAADSLHAYLDVNLEDVPENPERERMKKAWLQQRFRGRYTETIEQPALTARMDLLKCRARSPSFDKLCRTLESRI